MFRAMRAAFLILGVTVSLSPALAESPAERGKELAAAHCSRCHIVDESNRFTGISSTPSFRTLVTALSDWRDRFETFYARNPHPSVIRMEGIAPPTDWVETTVSVRLAPEDVEAITAYAQSIADAKPAN